jgi:anti-anti-sigma factor
MNGLARVTSADRPGNVRHLGVVGEVDLANVERVRDAILRALTGDPALVVLDLAETTYLDSAAIAMLFRLSQRLGHRRQDLSLVVPADSPVRAVLRLTRIDTVIPLYDTLDDLPMPDHPLSGSPGRNGNPPERP